MAKSTDCVSGTDAEVQGIRDGRERERQRYTQRKAIGSLKKKAVFRMM